jgi:hypothetical protein
VHDPTRGTLAAESRGMKLRTLSLACILALGLATESRASDHIDGVKTSIDNSADLTDVFVFTSPDDANKLVLIMNVHTLAFRESRFSNAVDYRFRIRPIEDGNSFAPSKDPAKERTIVCNFSGGLPLVDAKQRATCTLDLLSGKRTVSFDTRSDAYRAGGEGQGGGARIFAGVRSDPWFLDLAKTLKYNAGQRLPNGSGLNGLWQQNVLSIVVEVDKAELPGPLLAVSAQTVRK